MLDLHLIRTDGGTQSRVNLIDDVVADYCEAYKAGATFPPVIVFFDGKERWLADGFHRFAGAKAAGLTQIFEKVIPGTLRDAKLFSFGANGKNGQRTTNADKRKAVGEMVADAEWSTWSDRKIADACGVSVPFVGAFRRPAVAEKQKQNRTKEKPQEQKGCNPITSPADSEITPKPSKPAHVEPEDADYNGPSQAELQAAQDAAKADLNTVMELLESEDPKAAFVKENERLRMVLAATESQRDGYMGQCNELIRRVMSLRKKVAKLEGK